MNASRWDALQFETDALLSHLPPSRLRQFLDGSRWFSLFATDLLTDQLPELCIASLSLEHEKCKAELLQWWKVTVSSHLASGLLSANPLQALESIAGGDTGEFIQHIESLVRSATEAKESVSCMHCKERFRSFVVAAQRYIWDEVSYAFSLKVRDTEEEEHYYIFRKLE